MASFSVVNSIGSKRFNDRHGRMPPTADQGQMPRRPLEVFA